VALTALSLGALPQAMLPTNSNCDVLVLGGGITGITTAITLQAYGRNVGIVTGEKPMQTGESNPLIPTSYAMASAYPHNLRIHNLERVSSDSQKVFRFLHECLPVGISVYRMFEVFEGAPSTPPLADTRMNFQSFDGTPDKLKTVDPPIRPGAERVSGWYFDTYFADMPVYLPELWKCFLSKGGQVFEQVIQRADIDQLDAKLPLVNCLGFGALSLFTDHSPRLLMRGRQIIVPHAPLIMDQCGLPVAYNYTPFADVFSREDGMPEYVHFFARSDGWILGQTREPGYLNAKGEWSGASVKGPEIEVAGISVPKPILELNQQLLLSWRNQKIETGSLVGREGYRFYRDPDDTGVRLHAEASTRGDLIIHNYGHGGSGITMSWGCALEVARLLSRLDPKSIGPGHDLLDEVLLSLAD